MPTPRESVNIFSPTEDGHIHGEKGEGKDWKKLVTDICRQVEFYFSDANLRKDRFPEAGIVQSRMMDVRFYYFSIRFVNHLQY